MKKIEQAAFRTADGTIIGCGPWHDIDAVPPHMSVADEGFIDADGNFLTREEASAELHLDCPVQSEAFELDKSEPMDKKVFEDTLRIWLQRRLGDKLVGLQKSDGEVLFRQFCNETLPDFFKTDTDFAGDDIMGIVARQSGMDVQMVPEFAAARFLNSGRVVGPEKERDALRIYGEDMEAAALLAYGMPITDENRGAIKAYILSQQDLHKSDMDVAALPRDVEAVFPESEAVVEGLRRAFVTRNVKRMELKGKHSAGVAVAYDPRDHKHYLLKPGSGSPSPAAGIADDPVNQSRREVAFVAVARQWGLQSDLPGCELVLIDGQEVAAMDLLPPAYVNIGRCRDDAATILRPYVETGRLFQWAIMDYVLGSIDRHSGNLMVDGEAHDKVMLIDEGSTFAGQGFAPGRDPRSYIPYYLRAFYGKNFKTMAPADRLQHFPQPDIQTEADIQAWVNDLQGAELRAILIQYDIKLGPTLQRFAAVQAAPDAVDFVLRQWAGFPAGTNLTP